MSTDGKGATDGQTHIEEDRQDREEDGQEDGQEDCEEASRPGRAGSCRTGWRGPNACASAQEGLLRHRRVDGQIAAEHLDQLPLP